jgi:transcriptional regulator with XRE-family HTH domain
VPKGSIPVAPGERVPDGNDLRSMRLQRGWTQQELADRAGLFGKIISEIETGSRKNEQTRLFLARILTTR